MPVTIRPNKKATKIAWRLLGMPTNMKDKKTAFQRRIDEQLLSQRAYRTR